MDSTDTSTRCLLDAAGHWNQTQEQYLSPAICSKPKAELAVKDPAGHKAWMGVWLHLSDEDKALRSLIVTCLLPPATLKNWITLMAVDRKQQRKVISATRYCAFWQDRFDKIKETMDSATFPLRRNFPFPIFSKIMICFSSHANKFGMLSWWTAQKRDIKCLSQFWGHSVLCGSSSNINPLLSYLIMSPILYHIKDLWLTWVCCLRGSLET